MFATSRNLFHPQVCTVVVYICLFAAFKMYNNLWEYASIDDAIRIVIMVGFGTLVSAVLLDARRGGFPFAFTSWRCS